MYLRTILIPVLLLALAACGPNSEEKSPGAAERYLDNVTAHEPPADRAAIANGMDRISPSAGRPDEQMGHAPIFSREPVPPRKP